MEQSYFTLPTIETAFDTTPNYVESQPSNYVQDWNASSSESPTTSDTSIFTNTGNMASEWASSAWDWANTETGSSVIGGAISGAGQVWAQDLASDSASSLQAQDNAAAIELAKINQAAATERVQMQIDADNKVRDTHNAANNAPMNMSVRKFS